MKNEQLTKRELGMSKSNQPDNVETEEERIPTMQKLLDNPFLLLFLGVAMPTVLYLIWGVMEIVTIPIAK
jgi:hypothetical protein